MLTCNVICVMKQPVWVPVFSSIYIEVIIVKLREREGQRVDQGRSLNGHLWMVDGGWWYTFP